MIYPTTTPARLTHHATQKLPRWVIFVLCALYIIPGLLGRSAWKSEDVIGVAQMVAAADSLSHFFTAYNSFSLAGLQAWFAPQAAHIAVASEGPLSVWLGGLCVFLFGSLIGDIAAARLSNIIWFSITVSSLWYAVYLLGRLPRAQPLALPFGGQPSPREYGRMLADAAVLFLLATLGILWRTHESSSEPAILASYAYTFYALARSLDNPSQGAIHLGLGLAGSFLAGGIPGLIANLMASLALILSTSFLTRQKIKLTLISLGILAFLSCLWLYAVQQVNPYWLWAWWVWNQQMLQLPPSLSLYTTLRHLLWFLWPILPLASYTLFKWRKHWRVPHIQLGLVFSLSALINLAWAADPQDMHLLAFVIPLCALSVFALPIMKRSIINAIDWFSVMCFSFIMLLLWFSYSTILSGWPPKLYRNFARLTTGYEVNFSLLQLTLAIVTSLIWIAVIIWRLKSKPSALWRGSVLSATGIVCSWLMLMIVFLPASDYAKSYQTLSNNLYAQLTTLPKQCIQAKNVGLAQLASFNVYHRITFSSDNSCRLILLQYNDKNPSSLNPSDLGTVLWHGQRASDRHEHFYLIQRQESTSQTP